MATDGVKIIDGDLAIDTYEHIMELYDSGANAEIIKKEIPFIKEDYGIDTDFYHEIFVTAYALAFWEIGELTDDILEEVRCVINLKAGVKLWTEECDEKEGRKRQKELDKLLAKISRPNLKIRNRKKYRVVKNLYFQPNDVLAFKLSDNSYCAMICTKITQQKSQTTYDLAITTYKRKEKPTIEALYDEFIVGHIMNCGSLDQELLEKQPEVDILWDYHKHNAKPMTEEQKERTYDDMFIDAFEGRQHFLFGIPYELVTHKDMTHIKDNFEVVGKLNVKESFKRDGGYGYISTFEKFEEIFSDIDYYIKVFRRVKFPVRLLNELN